MRASVLCSLYKQCETRGKEASRHLVLIFPFTHTSVEETLANSGSFQGHVENSRLVFDLPQLDFRSHDAADNLVNQEEMTLVESR